MTLGLFDFRYSQLQGLSDQQQTDEVEAQRRLVLAIAEMRLAIEVVNNSSVLVEIEPSAFEDFVSDECPDPTYWAEKLQSRCNTDLICGGSSG
jgi:hypothetical protein